MTLKKLKVMICDDSLLVRKKLKESLEQCGCEILEATDGQIAVDMYKQYRPDLVFMDIIMPVVNGIEALQQIKEFHKNARVVMLSSSGTQAYFKSSLEAGAFSFIQKPWEGQQILAVIAKVVKEREGNDV